MNNAKMHRYCDPSPAAQDRAREAGIAPKASPEDVFATADVIVLSLPTAAHVEGVIAAAQGAGLLGAEAGAKVIIDTSTSEAEVSRKLAAALDAAGHGFLDAPVSGGPSGAASGQLSVMLGGDEKWVGAAMPALEAMAAKILHVGPSGAARDKDLSHKVRTEHPFHADQETGPSSESDDYTLLYARSHILCFRCYQRCSQRLGE